MTSNIGHGGANQLVVNCTCGGSFLVRPEFIGKRLKCPKCGGPVLVNVAGSEIRPRPSTVTNKGRSKKLLISLVSAALIIVVTAASLIIHSINMHHLAATAEVKNAAKNAAKIAISEAQDWIKKGGDLSKSNKVEKKLGVALNDPHLDDKTDVQLTLNQVRELREGLAAQYRTQREKEEAASIFSEAKKKIESQHVLEAIAILKKYISSPHTYKASDVETLLSEAEIAISETVAEQTLMNMNAADFDSFSESGVLNDGAIHNPNLSVVRNETLKRMLPAVKKKRADLALVVKHQKDSSTHSNNSASSINSAEAPPSQPASTTAWRVGFPPVDNMKRPPSLDAQAKEKALAGLAKVLKEEYVSAVALIEEAMKMDPSLSLMMLEELDNAGALGQSPDLKGISLTKLRVVLYEKTNNKTPLNAFVAIASAGEASLHGNYSDAVAFYKQALKIEPEDAWTANNLAWLLATCSDPNIRDGNLAVEYATIANRASNWQFWSFQDTMAAALAQSGDFDQALIFHRLSKDNYLGKKGVYEHGFDEAAWQRNLERYSKHLKPDFDAENKKFASAVSALAEADRKEAKDRRSQLKTNPSIESFETIVDFPEDYIDEYVSIEGIDVEDKLKWKRVRDLSLYIVGVSKDGKEASRNGQLDEETVNFALSDKWGKTLEVRGFGKKLFCYIDMITKDGVKYYFARIYKISYSDVSVDELRARAEKAAFGGEEGRAEFKAWMKSKERVVEDDEF